MRLVARMRATTLLVILLCLLSIGAGVTDLPVEDAGLSVAAECALGVVAAPSAADTLAAPMPRLRASYATYDSRLYRADLARVKRWGS